MAVIPGDQLLTRRQIRDEFGWSEKTCHRLENAPANKLIPVTLGKNGGRTKRYYRSHVEALVANEYRDRAAIQANAFKSSTLEVV